MAAKLKLNLKGFRELRTSPTMDAFILAKAEKVARRAGPDFEAQLSPGKNRARAVVVPTTAEAAIDTARNPHKIIGAMDAAR
jgi:hypothetical protein